MTPALNNYCPHLQTEMVEGFNFKLKWLICFNILSVECVMIGIVRSGFIIYFYLSCVTLHKYVFFSVLVTAKTLDLHRRKCFQRNPIILQTKRLFESNIYKIDYWNIQKELRTEGSYMYPKIGYPKMTICCTKMTIQILN